MQRLCERGRGGLSRGRPRRSAPDGRRRAARTHARDQPRRSQRALRRDGAGALGLMKLFIGLDHSDYQDIFRAIGLYIDEHRYTNVRVFETEEGIVVQGVPLRDDGTLADQHEAYLFTEEDLRALLQVAYQRRLQGQQARTPQ